ncbi:hypothetical protein F4809DRAFT_632552 [Biscogniauxia mediterranea]|nr:hypothetical protein F4809DRAFT_632552 [Biscogniauxia mediterranea]
MAGNPFQDDFSAAAFNDNQINDLCCIDFSSLADWSAPEPGSIQDDLAKPDVLMEEPHEPWDENISDYNLPPVDNGNVLGRVEVTAENESLDMNDPDTLAIFTSLVLFTNNPSTQHIEFEGCDRSKQTTLKTLAIKLSLQYSYDASHRTVQLGKVSAQENFLSQVQQPLRCDDKFTFDQSELHNSNNVQENVPKYPQDPPNSQFATGFSFDEFNLASFNQEMSSDEIGVATLRGSNAYAIETSRNLQTPASHHLYNLYSDQGSTQSVTSSIASRALRGPWNGLSRTLKVIGACWRCKILRKKCDPNEPCKACPKAENKSRWQSIGCRRGTLLDHSPEICLCPKSTSSAESYVAQEADTTGISFSNTAMADPLVNDTRLMLQSATARLEEVICSVEDTYEKIVLDILCSPIIDLAGVRCQEHNLQSNILNIVWGFIDTPLTKSVLHIENADRVAEIMKAASIYETEYGSSNASSLAIECLRNCIDILRCHRFLTPVLHANCSIDECKVESFRNLASSIRLFLKEFSNVIFRKENRPPDRRWWLSAFYGLYLQSFVRRAIMFLENLSLAHIPASSQALDYNCSTYLCIALELFEAASASYDPLISTWSLDKEPPEPKLDLRLIKYYRMAQQALNTTQWPQDNINNSMELLNFMYSDGTHDSRSATLNNLTIPPPISSKEPTQQQLGVNIQPPPNDTDSDVIYENYEQNCFTNDEPILMARFAGQPRAPLRGKRRASSPPGDNTSLRRNDSSSSILNTLNTHHRGLSAASQSSPISSSLSFGYDTSSSPLWNDSEESLASMGQLLCTESPAFLGPFKRGSTSLHTKSSNESFLEMPRTLNHRKSRPSLSRPIFSCDCCPTKPKRFDCLEALKAHESKRIYKCSYCGHRFKTKNEAERHQKSLHIRRRAWSCSVLQALRFQGSFHDSPEALGAQSICGYCGMDMSVPSEITEAAGPVPLEEQHERLLIEHLQEVHQVGQCNASKKFYRADHFRQHLKHSHNATLGKWTSVLETKCMREEDPIVRSDT